MAQITGKIERADYEIQYSAHYSPGDSQVRYFNDGSGYPGGDPEIEIHEIKVVRYDDEGNEIVLPKAFHCLVPEDIQNIICIDILETQEN